MAAAATTLQQALDELVKDGIERAYLHIHMFTVKVYRSNEKKAQSCFA